MVILECLLKVHVCRLGIGPNAGEEEVKSAYRALSKKVHPDKNRAEGSTEAFKKLQEAYRSLLEKGDAEESEDNEEEQAFYEWVRREAEKQKREKKSRKKYRGNTIGSLFRKN